MNRTARYRTDPEFRERIKSYLRDRYNGNADVRATQRRRLLLRRYGITEGQYSALLLEQGGRCAICREFPAEGENLAVDHDHKTKRVRGLLCHRCNRALGQFGESPDLLRSAIAYLAKVGVVLATVVFFGSTPARAQWLDPDRCWTCRDKQLHAAAGAAVAIGIRGPWTAPSWRNTALKRIALTCAIGAAYEAVQVAEAIAEHRSGPGFGFSALDLAADCAGAAALELVWGLGRRVFR